MKKNQIVAVAEGAGCSLLSLALMIIGIYMPALLLPMTILAGIPMMYLAMRHGIWILAASWVASVIILIIMMNEIVGAIMMGVVSFLPGMVLGYTLRTRKRFSTIIFSGAAVLLIGFVLQLAMFNLADGGHGITNMVDQAVNQSKQQMTAMVESLEGSIPETDQELSKIIDAVMEATRETILLYLPSFLIGGAVVMSYLIFMLAAFVMHRTRPIRIIYQPFWAIYAPRSMCYLALILFLFSSLSSQTTIPMAAIRNMTALFSVYFAVCGVAAMDCKFKNKIPSGFVRCVIYALIICIGYLFLGMLFQVMKILGLIDGFTGSKGRGERIGNE